MNNKFLNEFDVDAVWSLEWQAQGSRPDTVRKAA